ncbi:MAG: sulfatase-like hydrolase/transferase, partial [Verrucomicrobiales bacterium]|nr:sulfatase-like hydrolase/transferase [Verrucomicrobiales bacterium]
MRRAKSLVWSLVWLLAATGSASGQTSSGAAPAPAPDPGTAALPPVDRRPNLVLILADDLGWADSKPYGHPALRTPHLDRFAKEGLRFDRAYVTASACSPSRASIITGRYPHNTQAEELH